MNKIWFIHINIMDTLQYFLLLVILLTLIQPACGKNIIVKGSCYSLVLQLLTCIFYHLYKQNSLSIICIIYTHISHFSFLLLTNKSHWLTYEVRLQCKGPRLTIFKIQLNNFSYIFTGIGLPIIFPFWWITEYFTHTLTAHALTAIC